MKPLAMPAIVLAGALAAWSCQWLLPSDELLYRCEDGGVCPAGFRCQVDDYCHPEVPDGGPGADAGRGPDAGGDAGGSTDAGMDAGVDGGPAGCDGGQVSCDGGCVTGDCCSNADCGARVCIGYTCVPCMGAAQCGGSKVCCSGACYAGNCCGSGECSCPTRACSNYTCVLPGETSSLFGACTCDSDCVGNSVNGSPICCGGTCLHKNMFSSGCGTGTTCCDRCCSNCNVNGQCRNTSECSGC